MPKQSGKRVITTGIGYECVVTEMPQHGLLWSLSPRGREWVDTGLCFRVLEVCYV